MDRKDPEVHRRRLKELAPKGFDYVIEATGAPSVCEEALNFVRRRGTILVYGVFIAVLLVKPEGLLGRAVVAR